MKKFIKDYLIIMIGCLFVIQPLLQNYFNPFRYLDEVVTILMAFYLIFFIFRTRRENGEEFKIVFLILAISLIGIIGNYHYKYQTDILPIMHDLFNTFKVFITLLGSICFMTDKVNKQIVIKKIASFVHLFLIIAVLLFLASLFNNHGMLTSDIRYGFRSYEFLFENPGTFAMYLYLCLFIQTVNLKYNKHTINLLFIVCNMFLCITTLRTRAFIFVIVYIILLFFIKEKKAFKIKWYHVLVILFLSIAIGYNSFNTYFNNPNTARSAFAKNCITIAKKNFPIGTGFATYGTDVAFTYYSKVYYEYDMNYIFGLAENDGRFAHDTYWPAIIGQFGMLGFILVVLLIVEIYKMIYKKINKDKYSILAILYTIVVMTVASIATSAFFHYNTVGWFFLLPLVFNKSIDDIKGEETIGLCIKYYHENYGGMLQAYATTKLIEKYGFKYEIIRYEKSKDILFYIKSIPRLFNNVLLNDKYEAFQKKLSYKKHPSFKKDDKKRMDAFDKFRKEKFSDKLSMIYHGYDNLCESSKRYEAVITGSDQLWSPAGLPTNFYNLKFVADDVKKISYASSFGVKEIPWYQKRRTADYLNRIDYISVRENAGQKIIKELTNRDVPVVLDPVFMFNEKEWKKLIPLEKKMNEKYIFAYFLGANIDHRKAVEELSKKTGYKIVTLKHLDQYVPYDENFGDYTPYDVSPADFLNYIRNAEYVCTDSFHGSVFSIIHKKQFVVFNRYNDKSKHSKNSRIDSLCDNLGINNCRYTGNIEDVLNNKIDFSQVDKKYKELRRKSEEYLKKALDIK